MLFDIAFMSIKILSVSYFNDIPVGDMAQILKQPLKNNRELENKKKISEVANTCKNFLGSKLFKIQATYLTFAL